MSFLVEKAFDKKKIVLIVIRIMLSLLALWIVVGIVDFSRVNSFKKPIFCKQTLVFLDGGSGHYVGLGYSFDIKGDFIGDNAKGVTEYSYYLFGTEVQSVIRGQ